MEFWDVGYWTGYAVMAATYAVFTLGLNVHWGFTGLFNIGVAGFFALGAYTAALLTTPPPDQGFFEDFKWGGDLASRIEFGDLWFVVALLAAGAVCGLVALIIGFITLRLRDDYLAIATLGIAETVRLVFLNERWLANGSKGLARELRLPVPGRRTGHTGAVVRGRRAHYQVALGEGSQSDTGG